MKFRLDSIEEMSQLGSVLAGLGFVDHLSPDVAADWSDGRVVYDVLSDLDWYRSRWLPGCIPFRSGVGFHPIAGVEDQWGVYMECDADTVVLITDDAAT